MQFQMLSSLPVLGPRRLSLFHVEDAVYLRRENFLYRSAWPIDFYQVNGCCSSQPEVDPRIGTRSVRSSAHHISSLPDRADRKKNFCPIGVARTLRPADKFQIDPVIPVFHDIAQKRRL